MKRKTLFCLAICLATWQPDSSGASPFDDLISRIPPSANTLIVIDVSATLAAPVAQKQGWGKKLELAYVDRPIFLPPEATKLVMAASLRPGDNFSRRWELAAMELSEPMSMRSIARSEGGYVDEIQGAVAAWTPSDAYFVSLSDRELGVLFPAERQFVSRWVDFAKNNSGNRLSDYLRSATTLVNSKVPILLAIDLKDVVRPHELDEKLQESPAVKKANLSVSDISPVFSSLQGAVLRVAVDKNVQGQLRIDFAQPVGPIKAIAKEVVLDVLGELGLPIDELADWKLEFEEKAITMRGPLSKDGQRRVFSIIEIPSTKFSSLKDATSEPSKETPESYIREASLTYFKSVQVLFRDLRRDMQGNKAVAAVMERYARQIDRMPILNVDDELLDYGTNVATVLRSVALSKRQGGIQAGVGTAGMGYSSYNVGYYNSNEVSVKNNAVRSAADRTAIKAQAMAASKNARVEGKKLIEDSSAEIRRRMTKKYGVEF